MSLRVGESGPNKIIRVAAGFDLSSNTELTLTFTKPDADSTVVSKTSADGVVLGSGVTDDDLGVLAANEYVEYPVEAGFLTDGGTWYVYLTYTNATSTPDDVFIGPCASFTVLSSTCT